MRGEVKVGLVESTVAIAVEPREVSVASAELVTADSTISIAVILLAGCSPPKARLCNSLLEPTLTRPELASF
jgi:hypothetical protein